MSSPSARRPARYFLTEAGWEFQSIIEGLSVWGQKYFKRLLGPDDLDADFLMFSIRRDPHRALAPPSRIVVAFSSAASWPATAAFASTG